MSSINHSSGGTPPIVNPKSLGLEPMPTVKVDGMSGADDLEEIADEKLAGAPAKPPVFVQNSDVHSDLNALFEADTDVVIPPVKPDLPKGPSLPTAKGGSLPDSGNPITLDRTVNGVTSHYTFDTAAEAAAFEKLLAEPAPTHVPQVHPPAPTHVDQVLPPAPNPERNVQLGKARELLREGHVSYSTQSDAQIRTALSHKRRNAWTAEDYAAYLKINQKPRTTVDDSLNPVLFPGANIRRSVSADTTLAIPFTIPEGGITTSFMVDITTGVAPLDGSKTPHLPDWCISTTPGDFTENVVPNGYALGGPGRRLDVSTLPLPKSLATQRIILEPGKTYYLNFRSTTPDAGTGFVMGTQSVKNAPASGPIGFLMDMKKKKNPEKQLEYPLLRNF